MASPHVRWSNQDPPGPDPAPVPPQTASPASPPANPKVSWSLAGTSAPDPGGGTAAGAATVPVPPRYFTPHPPVLACPTCHHRDTGDFCSRCGDRLVPERFSVSGSVWKHMVQDRLVDAMAMTKTSWLMLVSPIVFFREVLQNKGYLAQQPFFLTGLWARIGRGPQKVLDPVKYLVLACGLGVVISWFAPAPQVDDMWGQLIQQREWLEEGLPLAAILMQILALSLYSRCLSLMLRDRVPSTELTSFMLYLSGFTTMVGGFLTLFGDNVAALVVMMALSFFVSLVVPYVALPRLYGFSRRALFVAQFGAMALIIGSIFLVMMMIGLLYAAVAGA